MSVLSGRSRAPSASSCWTSCAAWRSSAFTGYGVSTVALFLIGFAIVRAGIVDDLDRYRPALRRIVWWGLGVGGLASAVSAYLTLGELTPGVARTAQSWAYAISYPLLALAYASFVASRVPLPTWHVVLGPFAGVGRMALTVYVGQSVIYTTIYYGYGLGQFGRLGAAHILPLAVLVFALEILACNWWMRRFRFGPLEWLWRSATYLEWQPMRRVACKPL